MDTKKQLSVVRQLNKLSYVKNLKSLTNEERIILSNKYPKYVSHRLKSPLRHSLYSRSMTMKDLRQEFKKLLADIETYAIKDSVNVFNIYARAGYHNTGLYFSAKSSHSDKILISRHLETLKRQEKIKQIQKEQLRRRREYEKAQKERARLQEKAKQGIVAQVIISNKEEAKTVIDCLTKKFNLGK